jgi:hypothetical protein
LPLGDVDTINPSAGSHGSGDKHKCNEQLSAGSRHVIIANR